MKIYLNSGVQESCRFAKNEFTSYAMRMFTDVDNVVDGEGLYIGMPRCNDGDCIICSSDTDEIFIDVSKGKGKILGSNPGAVLIAVYRFFKECGARFLRPGKNGEYIPERQMKDIHIRLRDKASYKVRNLTIEGACSYENVLSIAEFAPKIGLNGYFMQFIDSFVFFERWYDHHNNHIMKPEHITKERASKYQKKLIKEFKKRGMHITTMGHGWTCLPVGLPASGWQIMAEDVNEETLRLLAMVDGERHLIKGKPMATNLCYSSPLVQQKIADFTVCYARENPQVDKVVFVLADEMNVCCECVDCKSHRLSDMMIHILNKIDQRLTAEGLDLHIIFPIYMDTLWEPVEYKLNNPDRFSITFCPISRHYITSYPTEGFVKPTEYKLNKNPMPQKIEENLGFLKAWQTKFSGCIYAGEYHYVRNHYADIGYQKIARIMHDDIQKLEKLGLDGMESYQTQRCVVPTGISLYNYGATLWDKDTSFDQVSEDYFKHSFGEGWDECLGYLSELSDVFDMRICYEGRDYVPSDCKPYFEKCLDMVRTFKNNHINRQKCEDETQELSWRYLEIYNEYLERFLAAMIVATKDGQKGRELLDSVYDWLCNLEAKNDWIQEGWDIFMLIFRMNQFYNAFVSRTVSEHM